MGSSPKTKADYRKKIASKKADLARVKAMKKNASPAIASGNNHYWNNEIARLEGEIANLEAKMADAPSK